MEKVLAFFISGFLVSGLFIKNQAVCLGFLVIVARIKQ